VVRVPGYRYRGWGFDSRRYQIFWEVLGLKRHPLSLVRITEELLHWKSSGSGSRKFRLTAVGIRCADHAIPSFRKNLALISLTCGGRSVGIVRLWTKITEFSFIFWLVRRTIIMQGMSFFFHFILKTSFITLHTLIYVTRTLTLIEPRLFDLYIETFCILSFNSSIYE
jgi:hypothetical protein